MERFDTQAEMIAYLKADGRWQELMERKCRHILKDVKPILALAKAMQEMGLVIEQKSEPVALDSSIAVANPITKTEEEIVMELKAVEPVALKPSDDGMVLADNGPIRWGKPDRNRKKLLSYVKQAGKPTKSDIRKFTERAVQSAAQKVEFSAKTSDPMADVIWVYQNIENGDMKLTDAPSAAAWGLLKWARSERKVFYGSFLAKVIKFKDEKATRRHVDDGRELKFLRQTLSYMERNKTQLP
jgi:hypothetical protein